MNFKPYPEPVQRMLAIAATKGIPCEVIAHGQSGRTSEEAAKALGVDVAAVIKTLVLKSEQGFAVSSSPRMSASISRQWPGISAAGSFSWPARRG